MILHDQHVHSEYSEDSIASLLEYYKLATSLGCKYFITTEHLDLDITNQKVDWIADYQLVKETLNKASNENTPIPLLGIEFGYRKDKMERLLQILKSHEFDLINLSIHDSGKIDYYYKDDIIKYGIKHFMNEYYSQMIEAIENFDDFNVLSHINYGYKTVYNYDNSYHFLNDSVLIKKVLSLLIEKGKALEINTKVASCLPVEHTIELLVLYKELGGEKITISSDAHEINRYLEHFSYYVDLVKKLGFKYLCYYVKREEHHFEI